MGDVSDFDDLEEEQEKEIYKVVLNVIVGESTDALVYTETMHLVNSNPWPLRMLIEELIILKKKKVKFVSLTMQGYNPRELTREYFGL